jgi:cellulose biosynthesis protein BcsQ
MENRLSRDRDERVTVIVLSHIGKGRSRLAKVLEGLAEDYDVIVLDCPPSSSTLSESIFRAADTILVPAVHTTLSQRSFHQLFLFQRAIDIPEARILGFFNMVQSNKTLHATSLRLCTEISRTAFSIRRFRSLHTLREWPRTSHPCRQRVSTRSQVARSTGCRGNHASPRSVAKDDRGCTKRPMSD